MVRPLPAEIAWPRCRRVTLKPFPYGMTAAEWRGFWESFRDPEIAEWNGNRPLRMPLWLFKRVVMGEIKRGHRLGFVILDEHGDWLGTVELYDFNGREATLGIILGRKERWGRGYGREAVAAVLAYAFHHLGLERVKLSTFAHNMRARRAFSAAGFRERGEVNLPGGKKDVLMEAWKDDWRNPCNEKGDGRGGSAGGL